MVVVGAGRIGTAVRDGAPSDVVLVDRRSGWDALAGAPGEAIVLAVRNDDLDAVLAHVPTRRRGDLVFVQNGALRTFLAERGLAGATRGVLYVHVAARGSPPTARTSFFVGEHAEAVAAVFSRSDIPATHVDPATFAVHELEKLVWLAANGPLCEALASPVGQVEDLAPSALAEITAELATVVAAAWDMDVPDTVLAHGVAWSDTIPTHRATVKEWPWRNGWIDDQSRRLGIATRHHRRWLTAAGHR